MHRSAAALNLWESLPRSVSDSWILNVAGVVPLGRMPAMNGSEVPPSSGARRRAIRWATRGVQKAKLASPGNAGEASWFHLYAQNSASLS